MGQIVQVDIEKIDKEIADLKHQIELRENLKQYISTITVKPPSNGKLFTSAHAEEKYVPVGLQISDFVVAYLRSQPEKKKTRDVINAYAVYTGKESHEIQNNIHNALSRLKDVKIFGEHSSEAGSTVWWVEK